MTETPKYIETQSINDDIDTMNVNRELIDSILEKNGVNDEVANALYDKIFKEIASITIDSDDYISTGFLDSGKINEGSKEEKDFFDKVSDSRNKALDALLNSLGEYSDLNSLNELFKYDEKLSRIVDLVLNNEIKKEVNNSRTDVEVEESFMDRLAKGLGDSLIPGTMKHNNDIRKAYASMGYEPGKIKN